jgi:2-polyprenyl-6-methoxyphenol hydroxylase-like FAD-dependent oxidoreductase
MMTTQGVVLFVPDSVDGADMRIGAQRPVEERDVSGWKALAEDKAAHLRLLRSAGEEIPEPVESAIKYAERDDRSGVFLWPFYFLSTLEGWVSRGGKGRVVLIGDTAHAFPPSGGQGAGMAIEDAEELGLVLGELATSFGVQEKLGIWRKWRKDRVDRVAEYTAQLGKSRIAKPVPPTEDGVTAKEAKPARPLGDLDDLAWLYDWRSKDNLTAWMEQGNSD